MFGVDFMSDEGYYIVSNPMIHFLAFSVTLRSRHRWLTVRVLFKEVLSFVSKNKHIVNVHLTYVTYEGVEYEYVHYFGRNSLKVESPLVLGPFLNTPKGDECHALAARFV